MFPLICIYILLLLVSNYIYFILFTKQMSDEEIENKLQKINSILPVLQHKIQDINQTYY